MCSEPMGASTRSNNVQKPLSDVCCLGSRYRRRVSNLPLEMPKSLLWYVFLRFGHRGWMDHAATRDTTLPQDILNSHEGLDKCVFLRFTAQRMDHTTTRDTKTTPGHPLLPQKACQMCSLRFMVQRMDHQYHTTTNGCTNNSHESPGKCSS